MDHLRTDQAGTDGANAVQIAGPGQGDAGSLVPASNGGVAVTAAEAEIVAVRQMLEMLYGRFEALQQNHARQFAGVHDRLDAVELEIPLIQESSALRIRDLEERMGSAIEEAAKAAVEDAAAGLQADFASRFGSLASQLDSQHQELLQLRDSRKSTESKLDRAIQEIERIGCVWGEQGEHQRQPRPPELPVPTASPARTRIAQHIRQAAIDLAPDVSNPLVADPPPRKLPEDAWAEAVARAARLGHVAAAAAGQSGTPAQNPVVANSPANSASATKTSAPERSAPERRDPGFEEWKRQFMQPGEPLMPTLKSADEEKAKKGAVNCPRCDSARVRVATRNSLDELFGLIRLTPHRCRTCSHRFYKFRVVAQETEEHRREELENCGQTAPASQGH